MAIFGHLRGCFSRKGTRSPRKIPRADLEKTINNLRQELKRLESNYKEVKEENRKIQSQLQKCSCQERSALRAVGTQTDSPVCDLDTPLSVLDKPDCVLDKPDCVLDKPDCILDKPVCPVSVQDSPNCVLGSPVSVLDKPDCVIDSPVSVQGSPVLDSQVSVLDKPDGILDKPDSILDKPDGVLDSPARETKAGDEESVVCGINPAQRQELTVVDPPLPFKSSCSISGFQGPSWVPWSENNHQALADLMRECRPRAQLKESFQEEAYPSQWPAPTKMKVDGGGTTMDQQQQPQFTSVSYQHQPWFMENGADSALRPPIYHCRVMDGPVYTQAYKVQIPSAHSAFRRVFK